MINLFKEDLKKEFNMKESDIVFLFNALSFYNINDAIKIVSPRIQKKYGIILRKGIVGDKQKLFFYNPNKSNIFIDHKNMFYLEYTNENESIDFNNYTFIKNWDTFSNIKEYCALL